MDRRLVEQQAAEYEAILRSIGDGLLVTDSESRVVMINEVGGALLGWEKGQVMGKLVTEVAPLVQVRDGLIPSLEEESESVLSVSSGRREPSVTYYLVRRDGTKFPAKITASSVIIEQKVVGTVIVFRDITLEREVEREKSDFVSIASHQLRTPLGSIKWNLEMLVHGEFGALSEVAKRTVEQIMESNQRLIAIVEDLLSVSRIERRVVANKPELVDVVATVRAAIMETELVALEQSVTVTSQVVPERVSKVLVDPKLFPEVVENLLTNAIKYNKVGGKVAITVSEQEGKVRLAVADTGSGIPVEEKERIFTKFFRGDNAIRGNTEGTGLGLFVAKSYVELWGGKIWFESELSKGSIFYIELPAQKG